jgi:hypothetical protein
MERETKEVGLPSGARVVLKTYLTIGEVNAALRVVFKDQTATPGDVVTKVPLSVGIERNLQLVLAAVVSIDGTTDNLAERVQAFRLSDYNAIFAEVKDLSEGSF